LQRQTDAVHNGSMWRLQGMRQAKTVRMDRKNIVRIKITETQR